MICSECGLVLPVMKTVYGRDDEYGEEYLLCDPCWEGVADEVWIVPGPVYCFGRCRSCGTWFSVGELSEVSGGGKWSAPSGVCASCRV